MDIDIRPVPVDKLVEYQESALDSREQRILELCGEYSQQEDRLTTELEQVQKINTFLGRELENVRLAKQLAQGEVVRVVCPTCTGTGMKPADVQSGHVARAGSAFESTGKPTSAPIIDERNRCAACKGQRWVIMPRFKG